MNPLLLRCPVCSHELVVTNLECGNCGTEIHGRFEIGGLARLDPASLSFIETFVKNRGNAYRVGEELELPYSAVRARLTEIIEKMGYETESESRDEQGITPERRKAILDDLAKGKITSEQAVKMLQGESG